MASAGGTRDQTLRIGVVGLGGGASSMMTAFVRHPHIEITAAADTDKGQLGRFQSYFGRETYLDAEKLCKSPNVDAVYIATPNQYHTDQTVTALECRKHVLIEKPMALTLEDTDLMIKAAEHNGVQLAVNVRMSFAPRIRKIREMVGSWGGCGCCISGTSLTGYTPRVTMRSLTLNWVGGFSGGRDLYRSIC